MKTLSALATTMFLLIFLAAAPAFPQDDAKPDAKAGQQEDKERNKNPDKNKDKSRENDKGAKPGDAAKSDEGRRGQEQPATRPDEGRRQNDNRQPEASRPQEQRPAQEMDRGHEQRQAQRGKHIPDDKFRASFGREHVFHVRREQVVNTPQPVVVYGGYSFQLVEAWPADWGFDDDVYVDYMDDGYYLIDPVHPGIRIAVFIAE